MRILMTADVVGGVWSHALDLAGALRRFGIDVVLAAHGGPLDESQRAAAAAVCAAVDARPYRLVWMADPWPDVRASRGWLAGLVREVRADVFHANDLGVAGLRVGVPSLAVAHSCVLSWWDAVHGQPAPPRFDRYRRHVAQALAAADVVVTPTAAMRTALLRHHGPLEAVRVIHNGVDPTGFRRRPKSSVVVTCGRLWDEAKDVATLARAARDVPWPVVAIGDDRSPDGERTSVDGLRPVGRLPRHGVAAELARAAVYVHPARYEPFGLAPLEAALSGCALVLADIPSLRELWSGCARFFAPGCHTELANALRELAHDPVLRKRLAAAAAARARRYRLDRCAAAYAELYAELTAAGRATATAGRPSSRRPR